MTTAVNAEYLLHVNVHYRESCSPRRAEDLLRPRAYRLHQQVAGMLSHPHPGRMGDDSGEPAVGAFDDASPVGHGGGAAVAAATVAPPRAEPLPGYHAAQCVQSSPPALHARHNVIQLAGNRRPLGGDRLPRLDNAQPVEVAGRNPAGTAHTVSPATTSGRSQTGIAPPVDRGTASERNQAARNAARRSGWASASALRVFSTS